MQKHIAWVVVLSVLAASAESVTAQGKIKGSTGGMERGAAVYDRSGELRGWTVTGPSGLYEFGGLEAGAYMVNINGTIAPYVRVEDGKAAVVDQSRQPQLSFESELWTPARVSFAQSFIANGTAITGFSLWRASGDGKLAITLYEDSPAGKRIGGPYVTEKDMAWICWGDLPGDEFPTEPGKRYCLEFADAEGDQWNCSVPRQGNIYPDGIAYYDGIGHTEGDLGISIYERIPGLIDIASAREDLHYIAEGPGSGTCTVAGQTFIATTPNALTAYANCGFSDGIQEFIFSIHEGGPDGNQIGPTCKTRMVPNWGSEVIWFPDAVPLTIGKQYYMQYRRADGKPFFSYLSADVYKNGRAYRDGQVLDERFDQLFSIVGETEPDSVIYPYNVEVVTDTKAATITWQTGTQGDEYVHFGSTRLCTNRVGNENARNTEHRVMLTDLEPGTVYLYRVSSDTHKESSRRMYSRIYTFFTAPAGEDTPRFDKPHPKREPQQSADAAAVINPSFEDGLAGWSRIAAETKNKKSTKALGAITSGIDGFDPYAGEKAYGWCFIRDEDTSGKEGEIWHRESIYQRIAVEKGREYLFTAHLLTGDRGSGWGNHSRACLAVDEADADAFEDFDRLNDANVTQWFATQMQWQPVTLRFKANADHAVIGINFLQWFAHEAVYLYVDEVSVRPVAE